MIERMPVASRRRAHPLLLLTAFTLSAISQAAAQRVTTPEEFFGHKIGAGTVRVVKGGLEITNEAGSDTTVIANAAAIVRLDLP